MTVVEVAVGRIAKAHGVRGDVAIDVLSDEPERRFAAGAVFAATRPRAATTRTLTLASARWHQGRLLARFDEIPDRNAAEEARGLVLSVELAPDEEPEDDAEFYDHQLIGLRVLDDTGRERGTVRDVWHHTGQDLLVVDAAGAEVLIPFVEALVPVVDLAAGTLTVVDRPGLLEPESAE